jgi:hypothetical protein
MRRCALVTVLALAVLSTAAGTASAQKCRSLSGPYVAKTKFIKVAKVRRGDVTVYRSCLRGDDFVGDVRTSYRAAAGENVKFLSFGRRMLTFRVVSGPRGRELTTAYVHELPDSSPQVYWQRDRSIDCTQDFQASQPPPVRTLLGRTLYGADLVVVYSSGANVPEAERDCYPNPGETLVVPFSSFYGPTPVAVEPVGTLPVRSVRVVDRSTSAIAKFVLQWTVAGVLHRHEL